MLFVYLSGFLGAFSTYYFHNYSQHVNAVVASSSLSFLYCSCIYLLKSSLGVEAANLQMALFFGGSFIGMSAQKVIPNYFWLFVTCIIHVILFFKTMNYFVDYGGKLGTQAFLSVFCSVAVLRLAKLLQKT